ncbi:hypothetical protein [Mycetocola reblochoni]|uniref:Uncharacterized protein n=2 Tax=Mycetocola reblochoni TaxID=331618 RepID=A0A1R4KAX2_9MICO|nr:hypothetical protein [Mycetocola reblochoni]RLP69225.1 hypothetical protein D9V30_07885 [Mycetocola reblochoni]SJN41466.1 hypothetical protein FM119_12640 [Mycetocola reblochoni REB411]
MSSGRRTIAATVTRGLPAASAALVLIGVATIVQLVIAHPGVWESTGRADPNRSAVTLTLGITAVAAILPALIRLVIPARRWGFPTVVALAISGLGHATAAAGTLAPAPQGLLSLIGVGIGLAGAVIVLMATLERRDSAARDSPGRRT